MKDLYQRLYFPQALNHIGAGEITAARECCQMALQTTLTPEQMNRLAHTAAVWAMKRPHDLRAAEMEALIDLLKTARPQQPALIRKVVNQVHHAWAFEAFTLHQWPEVSRHVMRAFKTNPALMSNRGLLSIWARSTLASMGLAGAQAWADSEASTSDVAFNETVRQRVESLLGAPVQDWRRIESFTPNKPRQKLYVFSDSYGAWVARLAVSGSVQPGIGIMQRVVDAGVPAPCARAEQLGNKHAPGLRIESFLDGKPLDLNRLAPRQVARLVLHIGEAMQRLHMVVARGYGLLAEDLTAPGDSYTWMRDQLEQETLLALLWMDQVIAPAQSISIAVKALAMLDDCPYADAPVMCHGDINPGNILVRENRLAGLIDWEFAQGNDPAYDCALFLAFTSEYWHPSLDNTFIAQVIEAFEGKVDRELDRRVNAYLQLCMLQELNVAVQFSLIQPWRNADKMRDYLLKASL